MVKEKQPVEFYSKTTKHFHGSYIATSIPFDKIHGMTRENEFYSLSIVLLKQEKNYSNR
jgi:hypothetical protein